MEIQAEAAAAPPLHPGTPSTDAPIVRSATSKPRWLRILRSAALIRIVTLAIFLVAWWLISKRTSRVIFASPQDTWRALRAEFNDGTLLAAWRESLVVLFIGLGIAAVLGITLGVLLGRYRTPRQLVQPGLSAIFMTPKIALLPIISLWLGYQTEPKIVIVVLFGFFQIYYTMLGGVATIDADYLETARAYSISGWRMIRGIVLPASLPYVLTSLRLGLLHGMVGVVLGGFFLETNGIGGLISNEASSYRMAYVFATLITVALVGSAINVGLQLLERVIAPWKARDFA